MRVAILDDYRRVALSLVDWSEVQQRAEVVVFDRHLSEGEASEALRDFDVLCFMRERMAMPRTLIEQLPRAKLFSITGPHHRTLDMEATKERGILVSYAEGEAGADGTTELAWGLIIALARHLGTEIPAMRHGGWQNTCGRRLKGLTLGLVGLGRLGSHMVPVAKAFGMNVIAWSQNMTVESAQTAGAEFVTKERLFSESDFVSLHVVLSERTHHLVGRRELEQMKSDACLVNTSRAALVDTQSLIEVLEARRIGGAAIDVFDEEPLHDSHPLRQLSNIILTPHLGYTTDDNLRIFYRGTVNNVLAFLEGMFVEQRR